MNPRGWPPVEHPEVVLSSDDVMAEGKHRRFNVVIGPKKPPIEHARNHQIILDAANGMAFLTLIDCSLVYVAKNASILRTRGSVTLHRRQQIQRAIHGYLGLG